MHEERADVLVIGSGGGLKIALPAARLGMKTILVEEGPCGGTCLNRGCIPSKMLIYPADLLGLIERGRRVNVSLAEPPRVDFPALVRRVNTQIRDMASQIEKRLGVTPNLSLVRERAIFVDKKTAEAGGRRIRAERVFIATGSRPAIPAIPGLEGTPYMTSTEALTSEILPRRLIVLGAGYIACELGHAYRAFGSETHFLVRSRFLRREDEEVQAVFQEAFSTAHHVHQGKPKSVRHEGGVFRLETERADGSRETIEADGLLVATGVTPNTDGMGLERTGLMPNAQGFIEVDGHLRTGIEGIYALGDCIGRYLFRHSVNLEGEYLARTVLEGRAEGPLDYGPMPHAVFADPEIAGAGATEQELREGNVDFQRGVATYADSNMGLARQNETGFVKLLAERKTGKILGAHAVGEDAATLMQAVITPMYHHATLQDLLKAVYIHPALPEIIRDAARAAIAG